jgi:hypothetical protein
MRLLATDQSGFVWAPLIAAGITLIGTGISAGVQSSNAKKALNASENAAGEQNAFTMKQYAEEKQRGEQQRKDQQRINALTQFNNILAQSSQLRGELSRIWGRR